MNITKQVWVYDIEVFPNLFTCTFHCTESQDKKREFIFFGNGDYSFTKSNFFIFLEEEVSGLVGFNNLAYDYPVLHNLLLKKKKILSGIRMEVLTRWIYFVSRSIIRAEFSQIPEKEVLIPQLDLFTLHHLDNKAKRSSLKSIQVSMGWPNVMDCELPFDKPVLRSDILSIMEYNVNDVESTEEFYRRSSGKIELRKEFSKMYNIKCLNWNDSKIGSELLLKLYSAKTKSNPQTIRKRRTYRKSIEVGSIIFSYIEFKTNAFQNLLSYFRSQVITKTKGSIDYSIRIPNLTIDYGVGGIHGCVNDPGVYYSDKKYIIKSADVDSMYPSIAIKNELFPAHLGHEFVSVYRDIMTQRLKAKKEGNKIKNEGLKLAINSVYGLSNSEFSYLYDPQFTMGITINGQLLISMMVEKFLEEKWEILMINTDGIEVKIPRSDEMKYQKICRDWEKITKLGLSHKEYNKLVIRDINSYLSIDTDGDIKVKGAFEIDKELYKDNSSRIVPLALQEYYVKGTDPVKFIESHTNILDFCNRFKANRGWYSEIRTEEDFKLKKQRCQKTNRYFISNRGGLYVKINEEDGREYTIEAKQNVTLLNIYNPETPITEYDIDYDYYIREVQKIVNVINYNYFKIKFAYHN